jgi:hypothetical protein
MPLILPTSTERRDHLVLPDDHAMPDDNFRRFEWLGNYIMEHMPAVIVKIGDSWDMPSLCSYDQGKKEFVFKNVRDDIEAGHKAEELMFGQIVQYNNTMSKWKKKQYNPLILKCIGNHEVRVAKLLSYEPRWEGSVSMDDFRTRLDLKENIVDYLDFAILDNIAYSHLFVSGVQGRPAASARAMLAKKGMSCTMGHTHIWDTAELTKPTGERARALICGSFHDPDNKGFAGAQTDKIWNNSITHKHDVLNGDYDLEEVSINRLGRMYV